MYSYYQMEGGSENWKPIPTANIPALSDAMFVTILSVSTPVGDEMTKEELADVKYKGPFYADFDAADSPASTAKHVQAFLKSLEMLGVFSDQVAIFASGSKGFHVIVPEEIFMTKPAKQGMTLLPQTYKELAFELAVPTLDMRVYTARRGRMLRQANVRRPNGLYKVRITAEELEGMTEESYKELCSQPRRDLDIDQSAPQLSYGMLELFDRCRAKVMKSIAKRKKFKPLKLPDSLPSFEAMLRGEGIKSDAGFHPLAMQAAITAHARSMSEEDFLAAAQGLCENHQSDGSRYDSPSKRRAELQRMYAYTDGNPCYEYSAGAIKSLLSHPAADLAGLEVSAEEVAEGIKEGSAGEEDEFSHGKVIMTQQGVFAMTEAGPTKITAMAFNNVTELKSAATGDVSCVEADVLVSGRFQGRQSFELDTFKSVTGLNDLAMRQGQAFTGSDNHARGLYLRVIEKARKAKTSMYVVSREGLDIIKLSHHQDPGLREPFMIWADGSGVVTEPRVADKEISFKFIGYPESRGQFRTDISDAADLVEIIKSPADKEELRKFLHNLLTCQRPMIVGRLLGWIVACHYRMLFHKAYSKFPIMHIAGAAGQGKCLGKDTPVMLFDGSVKMVQDVVVGDKLLGPDGGIRNVLSTATGREKLYKVVQDQADDYVVNKSHILSLLNTRSFKVANISVLDYLEDPAKVFYRGWRMLGALKKDPTASLSMIHVEELEVGDYYGFEIDGDKLFLLGDFTVTHNTEMVKLFTNFHYHKEEPKMLTPTTTVFAVGQNISGSTSIPLILDEFKPSELSVQNYDRFKLMMRDAYNCREVERGGGNRDSADYRALHKTNLSAPVCFIAEAAEDETALMERVVFTMMIKPPEIQMAKYKRSFDAAGGSRHMLGVMGKYMAAQIIKRYSVDQLKEDFEPILKQARNDLMIHENMPKDLTPEEIRNRAGAKDRTVFNYTVAKFGLMKFRNLTKAALETNEFEELFDRMDESIYESMVELQDNTIAEWLKVFNTFSDMAKLDPESPYHLIRGTDFAEVNYAGKPCLELYARAAYFKYRGYVSEARLKPLFHSQQSFVHAISAIPACVGTATGVELECPGGSHIFDIDELTRSGFRQI